MRRPAKLIAALALFTVCAAAMPAAAGCGKVPENAVWGRVSNASINDYVAGTLGGDWDIYIGRWQTRLKQAQGMLQRDSVMILHERGLRLKGEQLAEYTADIEARLKVSKCLAGLRAGDGPTGHAVAGMPRKEGS